MDFQSIFRRLRPRRRFSRAARDALRQERIQARRRNGVSAFFAAFFITLALFLFLGGILLADRNVTDLIFGDDAQQASLFSFSRVGSAEMTVRMGGSVWQFHVPSVRGFTERMTALRKSTADGHAAVLPTLLDTARCCWYGTQPLRDRLRQTAQDWLTARFSASPG